MHGKDDGALDWMREMTSRRGRSVSSESTLLVGAG